MHYTRSRTWTIAIELAIASTPLFRHDTIGPWKTNQPISSVQITPTISKASNMYIKKEKKNRKKKKEIKKTSPKTETPLCVARSRIVSGENKTVNDLAYCEPLQPALASNAVDRLADHRSRLNSCHEAGKMLEGCATKRKEKEEREETGPLIHRAALVDQLRGFAAAFGTEPRSSPSSTLLGFVRRHSAPFGVPRPAAEMRRAARSLAG